MGFGDDVITTALARRAFQITGHKVRPGNGNEVEWSQVFDGNPHLDRHKGAWLKCSTGNRPYILYDKSDKLHFEWNYKFRVEPGNIYLSADELERWAHVEPGFVYIEPNIKRAFGNSNKDWGFANWQALVRRMPDVRFLQAYGKGPNKGELEGVQVERTASFRDACALMSRARLFVGTDGGLHHAAAALGIPAVVVWGGFAPPSVLGYESHRNLCAAREWCGSFANCPHCRQAMDMISVDMVSNAITDALGAEQRAAA